MNQDADLDVRWIYLVGGMVFIFSFVGRFLTAGKTKAIKVSAN